MVGIARSFFLADSWSGCFEEEARLEETSCFEESTRSEGLGCFEDSSPFEESASFEGSASPEPVKCCEHLTGFNRLRAGNGKHR